MAFLLEHLRQKLDDGVGIARFGRKRTLYTAPQAAKPLAVARPGGQAHFLSVMIAIVETILATRRAVTILRKVDGRIHGDFQRR